MWPAYSESMRRNGCVRVIPGTQHLDLGQVQSDEIKAKAQGGSFWMALAMMVSTRLWLGGAISPKRDLSLIQALADKIHQIALCRDLLLAVDGLSSYVKAFRRAFRTPFIRRKGRAAPTDRLALQRYCAGRQTLCHRTVEH